MNKNKNMIMSKKVIFIIIAVAVAIGLIIWGYFFFNKKAPGNVADITEKVLQDAIKGALPSITVNPLEDKPDVNPIDKANAFKDIKINPF